MSFSAQFFLLLKTRPGLDMVSLGTFPDGPPGWSLPEDHGSPPGVPGCLVWLQHCSLRPDDWNLIPDSPASLGPPCCLASRGKLSSEEWLPRYRFLT